MPLLFSYGTLRDEAVQRALFGRSLAGHEDYLLCYEKVPIRVADAEFARTSGGAEHSTLRPAPSQTARVAGMAFEVTDAELAVSDSYEPAEYTRVLADLASGRATWVYVDGRHPD